MSCSTESGAFLETRILPVSEESISLAASEIIAGEIVAFPTETVYGLGANALNPQAVEKIFKAKGRPNDNPLIVHISDISQLNLLISGEIPDIAKKLMDACWPGPMTLIFKKSSLIPDCITAGLDTVAIRYPLHKVAQDLINSCKCPIAAPSANRSGRPSPTRASHVYEDMNGIIRLILDGGECKVGLESTVIDVTGEIPTILRPGGITPERIVQVTGNVAIAPGVTSPLSSDEPARSPGMKYKHYAPIGELTVISGDNSSVVERICSMYDRSVAQGHFPIILGSSKNLLSYGSRRTIDLGNSASSMSQHLFDALRKADELGVDRLFAEGLSMDGVGLAYMNRIARAAAFRIINV